MACRRNRRCQKSPATNPNTLPENKDNFRDLSLYPEIEDINLAQPKLWPIKTKGSYRSTEHYLDVHFKVLREDFVNPLRKAITTYRHQSKTNDGSMNINNIEIYRKVKFISTNKVCFDVANEINGVDWESTKRFMTGSLLMFTLNHFESFFLATVTNTDVMELKRKVITVELVDKDKYEKFVDNNTFTMVESESFFAPYYHVLKSLQELNETNFPFKKYFVDLNFNLQPPSYLNNYEVYNMKTGTKQITFKVLNDSEWPTPNHLGLDISQYKALKAALTNELAVIQGPPGTGKLFIGLKIVEVLLANARVWNQNSTPILVVCCTNHALEQFLEGILSFTTRVVTIRINEGGKLEKFNLREKRKQFANRRQNEIAIDLSILRCALVVGTTTTLAAKQRQLLTNLAPKIVIVEEAAKVLEAHIVASLTAKCQHLIMIGDHQQLRSNVNEVQSAKQYNLDVSLFERLIQNGMPYNMLVSQHRMRPEISLLLVRTIYPSLQNHASVHKRDNIKGMDKNIFFMTHCLVEEEDGGTSTKNHFETMMLLNLAKYLIKQGYKPEEITILAPYKAQSNYMEEKRSSCDLPSEIQITTVDNYQGEENRIILLSLVRSNHRNYIGFLKTDNRVSVALSRARDGFFIVGNMDCLTASSRTWAVIKNTLSEQQSYGASLPLRCQVHKDNTTLITCPENFVAVSHGGCSLPCGQKLLCGHICKYRCHGPMPENNIHKICKEPCARVLCTNGHRCSNMCYQLCDRCPCQMYIQPSRAVVEPYVQPVPYRQPAYNPYLQPVSYIQPSRSVVEQYAQPTPVSEREEEKHKKCGCCTLL